MSPVRKPRPAQPPVVVRVKYRPRAGAIDELADLVLELLDEQKHSGR